MTESQPPHQTSSGGFHTTRWTMVLQARGDAPEARVVLGELCEAYWNPVFRFLRREGRSEDESNELTQEFFARLLAGRGIDEVDRSKGRFRSYLLGALKHFLADQKRGAGRRKRGGGAVIASLDAGGTDTSPGMQIPDPGGPAPDSWFDREWALAVMERGLTRVETSFAQAGKAKQFEVLKPWLSGDIGNRSQADAAAELHMTTGAVKVAIHRLRQAFRDGIQREVAQTVDDPGDIAEELRYLIEVLS